MANARTDLPNLTPHTPSWVDKIVPEWPESEETTSPELSPDEEAAHISKSKPAPKPALKSILKKTKSASKPAPKPAPKSILKKTEPAPKPAPKPGLTLLPPTYTHPTFYDRILERRKQGKLGALHPATLRPANTTTTAAAKRAAAKSAAYLDALNRQAEDELAFGRPELLSPGAHRRVALRRAARTKPEPKPEPKPKPKSKPLPMPPRNGYIGPMTRSRVAATRNMVAERRTFQRHVRTRMKAKAAWHCQQARELFGDDRAEVKKWADWIEDDEEYWDTYWDEKNDEKAVEEEVLSMGL